MRYKAQKKDLLPGSLNVLILRTLSRCNLHKYRIVQLIVARTDISPTMCSWPGWPRKCALSMLTGIVLCCSSGCHSPSTKQNDQPNAAKDSQAAGEKDQDLPNAAHGTPVAVKEIVAMVDKFLADLPPPPSAPAVCEGEMTKLREVLKTAPGTADAANANAALLRCTSKATNETKCKGRPQPCGVVYYNPPMKRSDLSQPSPESSEPPAVDVSAPDQITAACREIAAAGDVVSSTSGAADPAAAVTFGSLIGQFSCGAWFKAAANNDPLLLIVPVFAPTIPLIRDLKTYTNDVVDVTPEAALADSIKRVDRTLVTIPVRGTIFPIAVLLIVPVGGTPGEALDGWHKILQQRVNQIGKAVSDGCKAADICH